MCYPNEPVECTCAKPNEVRVDLYDPQIFFSCNGVGSKPQIYSCPDGMVFDEVLGQCRNEAGLPPCTKTGVFTNPNNCSEYYSCIALVHGWVQKLRVCDGNKFFNDRKQICEDPCLYNFVCKEEGRFPDPRSKRSFFECYLKFGKMKQVRYHCPEAYIWYKTTNGGGKCVENHRPDQDDMMNRCAIPQDWCPKSGEW